MVSTLFNASSVFHLVTAQPFCWWWLLVWVFFEKGGRRKEREGEP